MPGLHDAWRTIEDEKNEKIERKPEALNWGIQFSLSVRSFLINWGGFIR